MTSTTLNKLVKNVLDRLWEPHPCPGFPRAGYVGQYWFHSRGEAYAAVERSFELAMMGELHGGHGPYGQGPPAWWERS